MNALLRVFALVVVSSALWSAPVGADAGETEQDATQRLSIEELPDFRQIFDIHRHQVISVQTEVAARDADLPEFFRGPEGEPARGEGSGFVVDTDGLAITNWHVVADAQSIRITTAEGSTYSAQLVGADPSTDIALIEIDAQDELQVARLGSATAMSPGQWVIAIGSPFGLEQSVTVGVLSAMGRQIGMGPYDDFLQTDASINPGNSGGPLYNLDGEVIGVNTAVIPFGGGIGFAVPIDTVRDIMPELQEQGYVVRGYIGAGIQDMDLDLAESFGVEPQDGVLIRSADPDGPADEAGLRQGDIITAVDDTPIEDSAQLLSIVAGVSPGDELVIDFLRDRRSQRTRIEAGERPDPQREAVQRSLNLEPGVEPGRLGVALQRVTPAMARQLDLPADGVYVDRIDPGSPASGALHQGDVILRIEDRPVSEPRDVTATLAEMPRGEPIRILVHRDGELYFAAVRLGDR